VVPSFIAAAAVVAQTDFVATLPASLVGFSASGSAYVLWRDPCPE